MKVAFLGLGIMGAPMAANLAKKGHEVTVWNRTPGKTLEGAKSAATPKEAVAGTEAVWICVSDTKAVEEVLFGKDGAAESLRSGITVVDSSTISPEESVKFAERVRAKGAEFIDAPITGSKIGATNGTIIFMVGGKKEAIEKMEPLFTSMGSKVIPMGDNGKGLAAKLAMNLMIVLIYEGFIEALTLARKLGVDQKALFSLINSSMVKSGVVEYKMPFVEKRDFSPNFPMRLMYKDMMLMLDSAKSAGVQLPGVEQIKDIYDKCLAAGMKDLDYAATLTEIEKRAGLNS
jgi:3-hydroxyisobutyrate dehydrogenase-like beta-hydroxyacid dehydrogenase